MTAFSNLQKRLATVLAVLLALLLGVSGYFTIQVLAQERPEVRLATVHASLDRESCESCHAPIAAEWRESFHFRSVTGPFWERIRAKGYDRVFQALRVACMNCHAPANVLDLADGAKPVERTEDVARGVDCVSCHVSERGILGPGRLLNAPHEVIRDERFMNPALATATICASCHDEATDHAKTVTAWRETEFARNGVTCLHCHMPEVQAPSVSGGPSRLRRSHRFLGDKSEEMLRAALNASILLTDGRQAVVRIVNDRVGHSFPASGMNFLFVRVTVHDQSGRLVREVEREFGTTERLPGFLDFWPFLQVTKIPSGASRDIAVELPSGRGRVAAEFRYRDWATIVDRDRVIGTITTPF
ncbi:MAG: hypothetical protein HYX46_00775 [Betaproteobacteria bacterium]|nr:hypothetical protein [Betaproteobacteria bacterium]